MSKPSQLHDSFIASLPPYLRRSIPGLYYIDMPKILSAKLDSGSTSGTPFGGSHPNVLKRNQACHQCRKRKLKCDANKPCSTCVRSHAHSVSHAPAGVILPEHPECTYDDVPGNNGVQEQPKNRYERLENRISELEALLREQTTSVSFGTPVSTDTSSPSSGDRTSLMSVPLSNGSSSTTPSEQFSPQSTLKPPENATPFTPFTFENTLDSFSNDPNRSANQSSTPRVATATADAYSALAPDTEGVADSTPSGQFDYDVFWPAWPRNLPLPNMLRHLVEVFFGFHPHAGRLFHSPSFMASLSLPPSHPKFPSTAVLHAICAVGSLYTASIMPSDLASDIPPDELFSERYKPKEHVDSFAEQQVKFAKQAIDEQISIGSHLLECVQAQIILTWWYWCHAKWVEVFLTSANALRAAVPLGLNACAPFHTISETVNAPSLLPPAQDVIEDEVRRNTFWLAYALERQHGCSNGWALSLDDQDVTQLLPVKGDQFDLGAMPSPSERQWAHSKEVLLVHPEDQTDSFNLYIKGTILLSMAKGFNIRFRSKRYVGDPSVAYHPSFSNTWEEQKHDGVDKELMADPRRTPAFIELDRIATSFRQTFPAHLRNPMPDGVVDSHLYTACLIPHLAIILLHDPHAHVGSSGCVSAFKILEASRAILDLIYSVQSTSYDISLLDFFVTFCWFMAGRVLVRFWTAAQEAKSEEQIITLRAEVEYIASAIGKFGERIPLAKRYSRMLNEIATKTCGEKIFII